MSYSTCWRSLANSKASDFRCCVILLSPNKAIISPWHFNICLEGVLGDNRQANEKFVRVKNTITAALLSIYLWVDSMEFNGLMPKYTWAGGKSWTKHHFLALMHDARRSSIIGNKLLQVVGDPCWVGVWWERSQLCLWEAVDCLFSSSSKRQFSLPICCSSSFTGSAQEASSPICAWAFFVLITDGRINIQYTVQFLA